MGKTNISFNDKNYSIDESALSAAAAALKSHLSTVMNGTGATINLDGTSYGIDAAKLTAATNGFVTHLGTISGTGKKVTVGGVEYSIGTDKVAGAVTELETHWGSLGEERLEGDGAEFYTLAPTALSFRSTAPLSELQEIQINGVTVDPSNYTLEEGSTIVTFPIDYLKTLNVGSYEVTVASANKAVSGGFSVKAPELNEHGFYYNQPYTMALGEGASISVFMRQDGTASLVGVENNISVATEGAYSIDEGMISLNFGDAGEMVCEVSEDGTELYGGEAAFQLGCEEVVADENYIYIYNADLGGYEIIPIGKSKSEYGQIRTNVYDSPVVGIVRYAFYSNKNLTSITIPSSITYIGDMAFTGCPNLATITFKGTTSQWNAITFGNNWNENVQATEVICSDGTVSLV